MKKVHIIQILAFVIKPVFLYHGIMGKLILSINMSLDGFADHTVAVADEEMHDFWTKQLDSVGIELFGRVVYELMEYWHTAKTDPDATKSMLRFAEKFIAKPKVIFSRTLKAGRDNERFVGSDPFEEVMRLKKQPGKDMSITGISLAGEFMKKGLIDEYLIMIHPVVVGKGRRLFDGIENLKLKLLSTTSLRSGAVAHRYSAK